MNIHPELRALRGDDSPQRVAQELLIRRMADWRETGSVAGLEAEMARLDRGCPLADCPTLAGLFEQDGAAAAEFACDLVRMNVEGLAAAPLGHVPFRHFTDGVHSTLLLLRAGNVTLSLVAVDGEGLSSRPAPVTADFGPSEVWEHVLAGCADAELVERSGPANGPAVFDRRDVALQPGIIVSRPAGRQAMLLRGVESCLVTPRLQRRLRDAGPTREYRLADGELVHQAAGNVSDSRIEMIMALLGRMERADAAPVLAEIAREQGSAALRWQALRECLALDTLTGFTTLCDIARSAGDELAPTAGALRAQLVEAHPQLAEIEPCPA
jgi:hypothetical protein